MEIRIIRVLGELGFGKFQIPTKQGLVDLRFRCLVNGLLVGITFWEALVESMIEDFKSQINAVVDAALLFVYRTRHSCKEHPPDWATLVWATILHTFFLRYPLVRFFFL